MLHSPPEYNLNITYREPQTSYQVFMVKSHSGTSFCSQKESRVPTK